jgi:hypothetical protein
MSQWLGRLVRIAACGLFLLVVVAPAVDRGEPIAEGPGRLVALFARDDVVRRTAVASALGLLVTAGVFFRLEPQPGPRRPCRGRTRPNALCK